MVVVEDKEEKDTFEPAQFEVTSCHHLPVSLYIPATERRRFVFPSYSRFVTIMLGKRRLSASQIEPPSKRRATSVPCTPQKPRARRNATFATRPSLDLSGLPETPVDSPGNPLGRHHVAKLARKLPDPTSFSKHVVLRMELVVHPSARRVHAVHRIVQIPLNYTFTHFRALIAYLFGGPRYGDDYVGGGHVFEVKREVVMQAKKRPGQIFSGVTTVKLSGSQHPFLHQDEEKVFDDDNEPKDDADDNSRWEAEEDFTIAQVWPMGLNSPEAVKDSLTRAIIWKSAINPAVQIHISINTESIKSRKGRGNQPFVFRSHGQTDILCRSTHKDDDGDDGDDTETDGEGDESDPMIARWNKDGAFDKFFRKRAIRTLGDLEVDAPMTPGLTYSSSPTQASSPVLPTPASAKNAFPFPTCYMSGSTLPKSTFPKFTPLPSAHLRKRVDSTEKFIRFEKQKAFLTKYDEPDSDTERRAAEEAERESSADPRDSSAGPQDGEEKEEGEDDYLTRTFADRRSEDEELVYDDEEEELVYDNDEREFDELDENPFIDLTGDDEDDERCPSVEL